MLAVTVVYAISDAEPDVTDMVATVTGTLAIRTGARRLLSCATGPLTGRHLGAHAVRGARLASPRRAQVAPVLAEHTRRRTREKKKKQKKKKKKKKKKKNQHGIVRLWRPFWLSVALFFQMDLSMRPTLTIPPLYDDPAVTFLVNPGKIAGMVRQFSTHGIAAGRLSDNGVDHCLRPLSQNGLHCFVLAFVPMYRATGQTAGIVANNISSSCGSVSPER